MKEIDEVRMGRYLSGETGGDEKVAFEKELESNDVFREKFEDFKRIWASIPTTSDEQWDSETAWQKFMISTQPDLSVAKGAKKINLYWAVAAMFIIAVGSYTLFWTNNKPVSYAYDDKSSDPISLSDGSKIYLNKGSKLDAYSFTRKKRKVTLYGEAFFEVAPDSKRPFVVESGGTLTEVVGTAFNISQSKDQTTIVVQKGKVIFRSIKNEKTAIALNEGEGAIFDDNRIERIPNPSPNVNAWHTKKLNFAANMSLAEIINDASIYFGRKISLENELLKNCKISSSLSYTNADMNAVLKPIASFINGTLKMDSIECMIMGGHCP